MENFYFGNCIAHEEAAKQIFLSLMFGNSTFCFKLFEGAKDNLWDLIMLI